MAHPFRYMHAKRGVTLVEAMLLLVIISVVAVAAGVGLQAVAKVPANTDEIMQVNNVIVSVMEQTKANLIRAGTSSSWPSGTWGGNGYGFLYNSTSYTPTAGTAIGTAGALSTGYSTPTSGSSPAPLTVNTKIYKLTISIDTADPTGGTSYKTDFLQVTVSMTPYINGTLQTSGKKTMVTYVTQP
jgi:type II secretory pathway pseudopilin PulG